MRKCAFILALLSSTFALANDQQPVFETGESEVFALEPIQEITHLSEGGEFQAIPVYLEVVDGEVHATPVSLQTGRRANIHWNLGLSVSTTTFVSASIGVIIGSIDSNERNVSGTAIRLEAGLSGISLGAGWGLFKIEHHNIFYGAYLGGAIFETWSKREDHNGRPQTSVFKVYPWQTYIGPEGSFDFMLIRLSAGAYIKITGGHGPLVIGKFGLGVGI